MPQTDAVFAGSIPAFYDRYLGPLFFELYAADLARRLADISSGRVLETAAGTGIVTRRSFARCPRLLQSSRRTSINPCWISRQRSRAWLASNGVKPMRFRFRSRKIPSMREFASLA